MAPLRLTCLSSVDRWNQMYEQNDLSPNGNDTLVRVTVSVDTPSGRASVESVKPCLPQLLEDYGRVLHSRGLNAEGTEFLCLLAGFTREDVALADAFPLNHVPFEVCCRAHLKAVANGMNGVWRTRRAEATGL